jgi:hypothetical protein
LINKEIQEINNKMHIFNEDKKKGICLIFFLSFLSHSTASLQTNKKEGKPCFSIQHYRNKTL